MDLQPLPVSRATNAYELMEDVNAAILAEPCRLNMTAWVKMFQNIQNISSVDGSIPACGTIGCYAGWTTFLHDQRPEWDPLRVENRALAVLTHTSPIWGSGLDSSSLRGRLRSAFNEISVTESIQSGVTKGRILKLKQGTRRYARAVVKRFERIMAQFEQELKAIPVSPVIPTQLYFYGGKEL